MELLIYEWDPVLFISYTQMCSRTGDEMHILSHYYTDQQVAVTQQHVLKCADKDGAKKTAN